MSTPALALVVTGSTLVLLATTAEWAGGWPGVRRVGRRVLWALGPLTRPVRWLHRRTGRPGARVTLDQAILDELRAELDRPLPPRRPDADPFVTAFAARVHDVLRDSAWRPPPNPRCARRGHRPTWDGYHETCRRCGARREYVGPTEGGSIYRWRQP